MSAAEGKAHEILAEVLAPLIERHDLRAADLAMDCNLVAEGLLDSFAFIELIADIEDRIGAELDLSEMDPAEFTTVGGLIREMTRADSCKAVA